MKSTFLYALASFCLTISAFGQQFINLDFEQAIVPIIDPESELFPTVEWELAAPGWAHSDAPDAQRVYYDSTHLGQTPAYTLIDSNAPAYWLPPFEGEYSLLFRNGTFSTSEPGGWVNAFISQNGLIPDGTLSIRLLAEGPFSVLIDDVEIPMFSLGGVAYGGDVSAFAGTVSELKILNTARPIAEEASLEVKVDAIQFSPEPILEPASGVLLLTICLLPWATRKFTAAPGGFLKMNANHEITAPVRIGILMPHRISLWPAVHQPGL